MPNFLNIKFARHFTLALALLIVSNHLYIQYFLEPKLFHWNVPLALCFILMHRMGTWTLPIFVLTKLSWPLIIGIEFSSLWVLQTIPETLTLLSSGLLIDLFFKRKENHNYNTAAYSQFLIIGIIVPLVLSAILFELFVYAFPQYDIYDTIIQTRFRISRDSISIVAISLPVLILRHGRSDKLFFSALHPITLSIVGVVCLMGVFLLYPQDHWWFYALIMSLIASTSGVGQVLIFNLLTIISMFAYIKTAPTHFWYDYDVIADIHLGISALIFISLLVSRSISDSKIQWSLRKDLERRNKIFMDSNPDVLLMLDANGAIIDYRDNSEIKHLSAKNVIGMSIHQVYAKETVNSLIAAMQTSKQTEHSATFIFSQKFAELQHFEAKVVSYGDDYLVFIRDISAIRNAERQRQILYQELKRRNEEMEKFTYTVSHDLKSPIITIRGFLDMAQEDLRDNSYDEIANYLERVDSAAAKMGNMLNDLLQLSRTGTIKNAHTWVKLTDLIEATTSLLAVSITKNNAVIQNLVGDIEVLVDEARMLEVLQNLIENSLKYKRSEAGVHINISVKIKDHKLICSISDDGMGISTSSLPNIFTIFHKLNPSSEGTGLGLALAKRIIENHNGEIWAESPGLGQGSTFSFSLPNFRHSSPI